MAISASLHQAVARYDKPDTSLLEVLILWFANPIYQEIISRVLGMGFEEFFPEEVIDPHWYIKHGRLDLEALLVAFQKFYRANSEAWLDKYDFREVGRQLLLMAFLQRIVNRGRLGRNGFIGK